MTTLIDEVLKKAQSQWMEQESPASDTVISSRIRLARNIQGLSFVPRMGDDDSKRLLEKVRSAVADHPFPGSKPLNWVELSQIEPLARQALAEKHLISPQFTKQAEGSLLLREDEAVSVMVLEEDHLRIQVLTPGLQLDTGYRLAKEVDDWLEERLDIAFDARLGYLTACPTNTGTGLRASVMLHLPGLVIANQINTVLNALSKLSVVARGTYGEGSKALANLFQISNQSTLGQSEEEIVAHVTGVARQLIQRERSTREYLYDKMRDRIEDRVCRAYGLLTNARIMSSEEAMSLLSDLRLGIDMKILGHLDPGVFNELVTAIQPGFLQHQSGGTVATEERDVRRARAIRERLLQRRQGNNVTTE